MSSSCIDDTFSKINCFWNQYAASQIYSNPLSATFPNSPSRTLRGPVVFLKWSDQSEVARHFCQWCLKASFESCECFLSHWLQDYLRVLCRYVKYLNRHCHNQVHEFSFWLWSLVRFKYNVSLSKERPTWCHLFYYYFIQCSTCFGR